MVPGLLKPKDVAERLNLSLTAVYSLCQSGQIPCRRVGVSKGRIRIEPQAVEDYLARTHASPLIVSLPQRRPARPMQGFELLRAAGYKG